MTSTTTPTAVTVPAAGGALRTIDEVLAALQEQRYVADRGLATVLFLALRLSKPVLLEGEAGVGKTEVAKVLAASLGAPLIRLQCYEGLDVHHAVYEWNYSRQLLHIRLLEIQGTQHGAGESPRGRGGHAVSPYEAEKDLFGFEFLIKRPLLQALEARGPTPPVLLVDEVDRTDEEFEAFLLELLSDWQITIPEIGTIKAERPPVVVITSNRTRELHDALKRRCLYHWIDYPSLEKELQIVRARVPEASQTLSQQVCALAQALRREDLYKVPGVAETLDWTAALLALSLEELGEHRDAVEATLGCVLKHQEDLHRIRGERLEALLAAATSGVAG